MTELVQGAVIAGKYRLDRCIGRGGMGSIWAARHMQLDTPVALKFIDTIAAYADDALKRFEREAKAAAQIRSPNVVQIFDHGVDGEHPYIVMELLEGEDLGERLRREKRLPLEDASRILTQAAKALRLAHDAGIIHRDLKPGNLFLARFGDEEIVKVLDFGVAKLNARGGMDAASEMTQTGMIFGSPSYMSPEQARAVKEIDHRSDLWSLAVILFRAITGKKPFSSPSMGDLVIKLCIDPLPVPSKFAPDLPPEVDRFFERALAREPVDRFATATELAAEFEAVAIGVSSMPRSMPALPSSRKPGPSSRKPALPRPAATNNANAETVRPPPIDGDGDGYGDGDDGPRSSTMRSSDDLAPLEIDESELIEAPAPAPTMTPPGTPPPSSTGRYSNFESPPPSASAVSSEAAQFTLPPPKSASSALVDEEGALSSTPPRDDRRRTLGVTIGASVLLLVGIFLGAALMRGTSTPAQSAPEALPSSTATTATQMATPPPPTTPTTTPVATTTPSASASTDSATTEPSAPLPSATASASATPQKPVIRKPKRPNFGY